MSLCTKEPKRLLINCKNSISEILNDRKIGIEENISYGKFVRYTITGQNLSRAETRNSYFVLPFLPSSAGEFYWIAITFDFIFERGNFCFQEVSLLIFEGASNDNVKQPILRAEWSDKDPDSKHAQPHWHVYPSYLNRVVIPLFDEGNQPIDFDSKFIEKNGDIYPQEWEEGKKFHYAMASRWHLENSNAQKEEITFEKLSLWIKGCLIYIKEQLSYVENRSQ
jgi:hypothetical protein